MHLKYKTQDFQTAAVDAVCDVFKGPVQYRNSRLQYVTEIETEEKEVRLLPNSCLANAPFNLFLTQQQLLANIQAVQGRSSGYLEKSTQLLGNGLTQELIKSHTETTRLKEQMDETERQIARFDGDDFPPEDRRQAGGY